MSWEKEIKIGLWFVATRWSLLCLHLCLVIYVVGQSLVLYWKVIQLCFLKLKMQQFSLHNWIYLIFSADLMISYDILACCGTVGGNDCTRGHGPMVEDHCCVVSAICQLLFIVWHINYHWLSSVCIWCQWLRVLQTVSSCYWVVQQREPLSCPDSDDMWFCC